MIEERFRKRNGTINRAECIRQAFRILGTDASFKDVRNWVKQEFNFDPELHPISRYCADVVEEQEVKGNIMTAEQEFKEAFGVGTGVNGESVESLTDNPDPFPVDINAMCMTIVAVREVIVMCGGKEQLKRLVDML